MTAKMKVRKVGNSLGTPFDSAFKAAMEAFALTRRKYRNALRALAK
jgi:hypothetical protein